MVRKRSRTARKYYDDENDSDSDFALEDPPSEPAQKKYSLRQRKRRLFTEFEFDDDGDEIEPTKAPSDDDDFEVETELQPGEADTEYVDRPTSANNYEAENDDIPDDAVGLIDFEDMIRADIVVNKNRIDYDNIIQKTEIKVQPIEQVAQPPLLVVKSKRGRKPKARPEGEIDSSLLEPETEMHEAEFEDKDDKDYNPDDDIDIDEPIDCAKLMEANLSESVNEIDCIPNRTSMHEINSESTTEIVSTHESKEPNLLEEEIKPEKVQENDQEAESCENDLSNVNLKIKEINGKVSPLCTNNLHKYAESQVSNVEIVDIDDDDVVLIEEEKKPEVIVLDD